MRALWIPTVQVVRYRIKRTSEILQIAVDSIDIIAKPLTFNDAGEPVTFDITFHINGWLYLAITETCDFHEIITIPASEYANG